MIDGSRPVQLTGVLDRISMSEPHITLRLSDGSWLSGNMQNHDIELLKPLFNTVVVTTGSVINGALWCTSIRTFNPDEGS